MNGEVFKYDPDEEEWVDPAPKRKRHWLAWTVGPLLFLGLYVLSVGPAALLLQKGKLNAAIAGPFYQPLEAVYDAFPAARPLFNWYRDIWISTKPAHP